MAKPMLLSASCLHISVCADAGIMVDGPKDMKPMVEAFAKQVCTPCLQGSGLRDCLLGKVFL